MGLDMRAFCDDSDESTIYGWRNHHDLDTWIGEKKNWAHKPVELTLEDLKALCTEIIDETLYRGRTYPWYFEEDLTFIGKAVCCIHEGHKIYYHSS